LGERVARYLPLASVIIPLICILVSVAYSPWFNIFDNALSDLGHAVKSSVAPLFNIGLVLGGLSAYTTAIVSRHIDKHYNIVLMYTGVSLILVGVFDEVYRLLHFMVSVLFFIGIALFLLLVALKEEMKIVKLYSATALVVIIVVWIIYFTYRVPRGAAIPEITSVALFAPAYLHVYY
jgi:hypothetical membrane protein